VQPATDKKPCNDADEDEDHQGPYPSGAAATRIGGLLNLNVRHRASMELRLDADALRQV